MSNTWQESITDLVKEERYIHDGTMTICVLELNCGFKVLGQSACVDPSDYDDKLGERLSRPRAYERLRELEVYHHMRSAEEVEGE